jgi:cytoskeletal protein CcmA (bactofilin family)
MMDRKSKPVATVKGSTTLIAADAVVTGDIKFVGNLDIEGKVVGSITAEPGHEALLRIVAGGTVEGEVRVPSAMVNGTVRGDLYVSERLELAEKAEVQGDVYYNLIEMAVGCKVNGGLRHSLPVADDLSAKRIQRATETPTG